MNRRELERRLAAFQIHDELEKIEISERDPTDFHVALTLKPNIPISERLILRLRDALEESPRSLALLRSGADAAILRFTVRRSADDENEAGRVQETAPAFYAEVELAKPLVGIYSYKKYRLARTTSQTR
jgi:hypothetical protein